MKADPLYIEAHLGYLFGMASNTGGIVVVSDPTEQGWRSRCFTVRELDQTARYAAQRSNSGANVFVRVSLLAASVPTYKRGTKNDTGFVTCFAGDVDIAGPGHAPAADGLPLPDRGQAEAICHALLTPSYIVFSGGGFYPFWRLTESWDVRDEEARARYLALDRVWGLSHAEVGRRAGVHVDNVGDGTRVLRPPGVVNHKKGRDPRLVTVHLGCAMGGGDYTIDQIEAACIVPTRPEVKPAARGRPAGEATVWDTVAELYTLEEVLRADHRFGPWVCRTTDSKFDYWLRAGADSTYSVKHDRTTGVVIVWSSVVAGELGVSPGEGLNLFGFACKLEGTDPRRRAAEIMRKARGKRRSAA
jgi:hypothetical protein